MWFANHSLHDVFLVSLELKMHRTMRISTLPILVLLGGCGQTNVEPQGECLEESGRVSEVSDDRGQLVSDNDAFAWAMFERLRSDAENLVFSPISMSAALDMTRLGARGVTLEEMAGVLGNSQEESLHHVEQGSLLQEIEGSDTCWVNIAIANRVFPHTGLSLEADFESALDSDYDSPADPLDFSADSEAARAHINDWVSEQTHEKIPELFPDGTIDESTRMVLANAIYMKADWAQQFDVTRTADAEFLRLDGSTANVLLMHNEVEDGLYFAQVEGARIAELPYVGGEISMVVVVPDDSDGLLALEQGLDGDIVRGWFDALTPEPVAISLPRFEMRWRDLLNETLQGLGMEAAFGPGADFSGMTSDVSLRIDMVLHEAFVMIDEEGTEAAAATGVGMDETSVAAFQEVVADHPFLFLVRDRITDSVLFIGRVVDPIAG
jgi:serpin B